MTGRLSCTILLFFCLFQRTVPSSYIGEKDEIKVEEIYDNDDVGNIEWQL